jgi:hypothetical protein
LHFRIRIVKLFAKFVVRSNKARHDALSTISLNCSSDSTAEKYLGHIQEVRTLDRTQQ